MLKDQKYETIKREIDVQGQIKHPNIVELFNTVQTAEATYLFMELCDFDLQTYISTQGF